MFEVKLIFDVFEVVWPVGRRLALSDNESIKLFDGCRVKLFMPENETEYLKSIDK